MHFRNDLSSLNASFLTQLKQGIGITKQKFNNHCLFFYFTLQLWRVAGVEKKEFHVHNIL